LRFFAGRWSKGRRVDADEPSEHSGIENRANSFRPTSLTSRDFKQSDWTFEGRGNLAVVTTGMEWTFKDDESKKGKQIVIMVKDAEGSWRAQKAIYNLDVLIQVGAARRPPPPDRPSLDGQASPEGEACT